MNLRIFDHEKICKDNDDLAKNVSIDREILKLKLKNINDLTEVRRPDASCRHDNVWQQQKINSTLSAILSNLKIFKFQGFVFKLNVKVVGDLADNR